MKHILKRIQIIKTDKEFELKFIKECDLYCDDTVKIEERQGFKREDKTQELGEL